MDTEKFYNLLGNQDLLNHETVGELKLITEQYPWFQLGWMMYLKNLKEIESSEYNTELKKCAIQVNDRKILFNFLDAEIIKKNQKTELVQSINSTNIEKKEKGKANPLIDKFLSSEPGKIERQPGEKQSAGNHGGMDIVEKSDAENDDIITETLATIYVQQKNYEKAIQAYEKLSLKYPEKSIYFAGQIKELEKLKNTNQ
jgi:tetratricopeptide (TPR) repeat protein